MSIDLSLAAIAKQERQDAKELSEEDIIIQQATQPCRVLFDLPDSSQVESEFQVSVVSVVSHEKTIPKQERLRHTSHSCLNLDGANNRSLEKLHRPRMRDFYGRPVPLPC